MTNNNKWDNHDDKSSDNNSDLATLILLNGAKGKSLEDTESAHAMLGILSGNIQIIRPVPSDEDKVLGKSAIYNTLDTQGNPLISGENYIYRGNKVKVLREQFGAGNILDTYMRIYFLNTDLKTDTTIIDASYRKGILKGPVYQSQFEPIKEEKQ